MFLAGVPLLDVVLNRDDRINFVPIYSELLFKLSTYTYLNLNSESGSEIGVKGFHNTQHQWGVL